MKTKKILIPVFLFCLALLFSSFCFAEATSYVVGDTFTPQGEKSLFVQANENEFVEYSVDLKPNMNYSLQFLYKLSSGKFGFEIVGPYADEHSDYFSATNYNRHFYTFETGGESGDPVETHQLRFTANDGPASWWLDALQLEPSPQPTKFNDFKHSVGCCPFDFCYTGGVIPDHPECIHDDFYEKNVSQPPIGFDIADFGPGSEETALLDSEAGYRCINGSWVFSRPKTTPIHDSAGFCPEDNQCFIGGSDLASEACVEHGTFHMYNVAPDPEPVDQQSFYCYNGNWTTRTKEIALQLLAMTGPGDSYTLFCDSFDRSLNSGQNNYYWRDYVGEDITATLMGNSMNEFCVMDLDGQVIVGTSLNVLPNSTGSVSDCVPCTDTHVLNGECDPQTNCFTGTSIPPSTPPKPFLVMLKGPDREDYCDGVLENKDGFYHACENDDVYYNAKLQTIIFSKPHEGNLQPVPFKEELSLIGRAWEYMKSLFISLLGTSGVARPAYEEISDAELDFIRNAGSFNRLFISLSPGPNGNPREIKGIVETRAHRIPDSNDVEIKTFLTIDYLNYQVPICRYFYKHNLPELQQQISGMENAGIHCAPVILDDDQWKYSVYVEEPFFGFDSDHMDFELREWTVAADNFWNDMTAAIRTKPYGEFENSISPQTPAFSTAPSEHPVVGSMIRFGLTSEPQEDERLIAITWDFNDSEISTSRYNVTAYHTYGSAQTYYPRVRVMNQYYEISESEALELPVDVGPSVTVENISQLQDGELRVNVSFPSFVNSPVGFEIDWKDSLDPSAENTRFDSFNVSETPWVVAAHNYTFTTEYPVLDPDVNITGSDRDGVPFDNHKSMIVRETLS